MEKEIIDTKVIENNTYQLEIRGELEGFYHVDTSKFYAMKKWNRQRLDYDVYDGDEYEGELFVEVERAPMLPELWVNSLHEKVKVDK